MSKEEGKAEHKPEEKAEELKLKSVEVKPTIEDLKRLGFYSGKPELEERILTRLKMANESESQAITFTIYEPFKMPETIPIPTPRNIEKLIKFLESDERVRKGIGRSIPDEYLTAFESIVDKPELKEKLAKLKEIKKA